MTYKSLLCLNGALPEKDFFEKHALPLIAADGAADRLYERGITPHIIIGDLDSIKKIPPHIQCVHREDQNFCDYEKAMSYLAQHNLLPTIVLGINGGDLDHILNNIGIFSLQAFGSLLYAPPLYGTLLYSGDYLLTIPVQTKISIMGLPKAKITTKGLTWDVTEKKFSFPGFGSFSNRMKDDTLSIHIVSGKALFLAHAFFSLERAPSEKA